MLEKTPYTYWEVFKYGKDKDKYEITNTGVERFLGLQIILKETKCGLIMKEIHSYDNDDSETLITPYGGITGATFKRISEYDEISFTEASCRLKQNEVVYALDGQTYKRVSLFTDFEEFSVADLDDLLSTRFFAKL